MTMTGSSGSSFLAARSTPNPSPLVSRRSESTTPGRALRSAAAASVWSRASTTVCPCASSAWRSIARSESLSSTSRIGGSTEWRDRTLTCRDALPQPAGRDARVARFLEQIGDRFLRVLNALRKARELRDRLLTVLPDHRALRRIVTAREVGREDVDAGLHRIGVVLIPDDPVLQTLEAGGPVLLVFGGRLVVGL